MDIYRLFHPYHNPKLRVTPVRQLELCELEHCAAEFLKAMIRFQDRLQRKPVTPIMSEHLTDVIKALGFVERSLQTLCDAHPGDSDEALQQLIEERSEYSGWENWVCTLRQQLQAQALEAEAYSARGQSGSLPESLAQKVTPTEAVIEDPILASSSSVSDFKNAVPFTVKARETVMPHTGKTIAPRYVKAA
jgi:hypothetical protein